MVATTGNVALVLGKVEVKQDDMPFSEWAEIVQDCVTEVLGKSGLINRLRGFKSLAEHSVYGHYDAVVSEELWEKALSRDYLSKNTVFVKITTLTNTLPRSYETAPRGKDHVLLPSLRSELLLTRKGNLYAFTIRYRHHVEFGEDDGTQASLYPKRFWGEATRVNLRYLGTTRALAKALRVARTYHHSALYNVLHGLRLLLQATTREMEGEAASMKAADATIMSRINRIGPG